MEAFNGCYRNCNEEVNQMMLWAYQDSLGFWRAFAQPYSNKPEKSVRNDHNPELIDTNLLQLIGCCWMWWDVMILSFSLAQSFTLHTLLLGFRALSLQKGDKSWEGASVHFVGQLKVVGNFVQSSPASACYSRLKKCAGLSLVTGVSQPCGQRMLKLI